MSALVIVSDEQDRAIVQLERARLALAECKTVMEAKQIADMADAARTWARRAHASIDLLNSAVEIKIMAERKMGELLSEMPKNKGARMAGKDERGASVVVPPDRRETLRDLGISKDESARAQKLAKIPPGEVDDKIAEIRATGKKITLAALLDNKPHRRTHGADGRALPVVRDVTSKRNREVINASIQFLVSMGSLAESIAIATANKNYESAFCGLTEHYAAELDKQFTRGIDALGQLRKRIRNERKNNEKVV